MSSTSMDRQDAKGVMRRAAYDARSAQENKDAVSSAAIARLREMPRYRAARTVLWYIDCRSELRTRTALPDALRSGQRIVVPYCTVDDDGANKLGLWRLESCDELVMGKWKILEPPADRWHEPERLVHPRELDFVIVPGVAFSRDGGRLGNGQGYYDRLLQHARPDCPLVGLCYESQLFDELIVSPHDVFMDQVVTESAVYQGRGRELRRL